MAVWYLKKGSDPNFTLDDKIKEIALDLPKRRIKIQSTGSNGGQIVGSNTLNPRVFRFTKRFRADQEAIRKAFLQIINTGLDQELYLYKNTSLFTGRTRVYGTNDGGEKYSNLAISDPVSFRINAPDPLFTSTTETTESYTVAGTTEETKILTNPGFEAIPTIEFTPSADFSLLRILIADGAGLLSQRDFNSGELIKITVENSTLVMRIDGVIIPNVFVESSRPFLLRPGSNSIYITATSCAANNFKIKYNETDM